MLSKLKLVAVAVCVSVIPMIASSVQAQSSSFPHVKGKNCPSGFTESRDMCTDKKGKKEGLVKAGSCPKGFIDTGAYCYREKK